MGLRELIEGGATLENKTVSFVTSADESGSFAIDPAFIITGIEVDTPCRLRLYESQLSMENADEQNRNYGLSPVSSSITLVGDFTASAAGQYSINPVLYSVVEDHADPKLYYRVEAAGQVSVSLDVFNIEDSTSSENRKSITITENSLSSGTYRSGSISIGVPRTYLLVSSSLQDPSHNTRLRLYSTNFSFNDSTEINRGFYEEVSASAYLIADMLVTGSETTYFVPKIIGANIETIGDNLFDIRVNKQAIDGVSEIYYVIENISTGTTVDVNQGLYLYSLED